MHTIVRTKRMPLVDETLIQWVYFLISLLFVCPTIFLFWMHVVYKALSLSFIKFVQLKRWNLCTRYIIKPSTHNHHKLKPQFRLFQVWRRFFGSAAIFPRKRHPDTITFRFRLCALNLLHPVQNGFHGTTSKNSLPPEFRKKQTKNIRKQVIPKTLILSYRLLEYATKRL